MYGDFDRTRAIKIAEEEEVKMTQDHWIVIILVTECYCDDKVKMLMSLQKSMEVIWGSGDDSFKRLYQMFPGGLNQALRISSLENSKSIQNITAS